MTTESQTPATSAAEPAAATPPVAEPTSLLTTPPVATEPASSEPTQTPAPAPAADAPSDKAPKDDKPQGAPEHYGEFVAPEGVKFDDSALDEFKALAKEKNLSQEDAQKFADLGAKNAQRIQAEYTKQIEAAQTQWAQASRADKEFGGDKLPENMAVAKRALDTFGTPELSKLLAESGLGNHPDIVRVFFRVGKAISEDRLVAGTKAPANVNDARSFYPKSNHTA